jgi:sterol 3beta-glucosyltransferase
VPFFGDQFFWGERIHARRVGPAPIPIAELTVESLSNAIRFMLDPEVELFLVPLLCDPVSLYAIILMIQNSVVRCICASNKLVHGPLLKVKSRTMELARAIGNEDGVAAAVDAFHRHLPSELPLAPPTHVHVGLERQDLFQWFSRALEKCCSPFNFQ